MEYTSNILEIGQSIRLEDGLYVDKLTNNVGIGNDASAGFKLDVTGTARFSGLFTGASATFSSSVTATSLIVNTSGQARTISTFYGVGSDGQNIFIGGGGLSSGTGGGASTNGSQNTAVGVLALRDNTTGNGNTANGVAALRGNTTGINNTAIGLQALLFNTTGFQNTALGVQVLQNNTTGANNTALGYRAGGTVIGGSANNITNNSIYIGANTRAAADNQTNQIVIGYAETGLGSNTTIIGNASTVTTALRGRLILGTTTDDGVNQLQVTGTTLLSPAADTTPLTISGYSVTGSGTTPAISLTGTWNTTGTVSAIFANITNTASPFGAQLMDLRVNNSTVFGVQKNGITANNAPLSFFGTSGNRKIYFSGNGTIEYFGSTTAQNCIVFNNFNTSITATTGTTNEIIIANGFAPTSGTAGLNVTNISPTINQTGGANGITRGLYVNPTLTAAADWRSIEWSNNTGWGLYGAGTANNYMAGALGIGSTSLSGYNLRVDKSITGLTTSTGIASIGTIQSDVTSNARMFTSFANTQATTFTLANLYHYQAQQGTFGVNSVVTNQFGFVAEFNMIGATNNFGFFGNIAAAANRWNFYANGTALNYMNGALLIATTTDAGFKLDVNGTARVQGNLTLSAALSVTGVTTLSDIAGIGGVVTQTNLNISRAITGAVTANGIQISSQVGGTVTTAARYFSAIASTAAGTLTDLFLYRAAQGTLTGTVTNQYGYAVEATLIGATNNYGFRGAIPSGSNRWNLYMDGTALNYLNGDVLIGSTTPVASAKVLIDSTTQGFLPPRMTTTEKNAIVTPAAGLVVYDTTTNKLCCYDGSIWNDLF